MKIVFATLCAVLCLGCTDTAWHIAICPTGPDAEGCKVSGVGFDSRAACEEFITMAKIFQPNLGRFCTHANTSQTIEIH